MKVISAQSGGTSSGHSENIRRIRAIGSLPPTLPATVPSFRASQLLRTDISADWHCRYSTYSAKGTVISSSGTCKWAVDRDSDRGGVRLDNPLRAKLHAVVEFWAVDCNGTHLRKEIRSRPARFNCSICPSKLATRSPVDVLA